ncbi:hypothetical protein [Neisseria sp. P0017.S007]|uniref:hypothetical protein n=1 Tax=unclassified Neisseria TaxID=2623750 RepID=UPI003F7EB7F5
MYKLNKQDAIAYDQRGGYINQAGKYVVTIESAVFHVGNNANGRSENLKLSVIDNQKRKATFFINTSYSNGVQNEGGLRTVSAILACLREHDSGEPTPAQVKEYNRETQQEEAVMRDCFTKLHGKQLGIVVQMVHEDGRENPSPSLYSVFEASSELTASEIMREERQPAQLGKIMAYIANKPLVDKRKNSPVPPQPTRQPAQQPTAPTAPVEDIDSDIPF